MTLLLTSSSIQHGNKALVPSSSAAVRRWRRISWQPMILLLVLLQLISFARPTLGFASWLKCYVELDPSEVIMWQRVVPAHEAKHKVHIEVQPYGFGGGDKWLSTITTTSADSADDDKAVVPLPAAHPGNPLTLRVRLNVPPALQGEDVQFVIELKTSAADGAAEAVEFIDRGVMCDGSRAFSRRHDEHVILQIDTHLHPDLEYVALTAGWASEMEAVNLTPTLILKPATAAAAAAATSNTKATAGGVGDGRASEEL